MTWVAITEDTVLDGTMGDDAGDVMLHLMRSHPSAVARDLMSWIMMRHSRMESAVIALIDPSFTASLKEDYLDFVAICARNTGVYTLTDCDIEIREVVPIDNES